MKSNSRQAVGSTRRNFRFPRSRALAAGWVRIFSILILSMTLAGCGGGSSSGGSKQGTPYTVTVSASSSTPVQAGTTLELTVKGLQNSVAAADVTAAFTPSGSVTPTATAIATAAQDQGSGTYLISFTVPSSLQPPQPANYAVGVSGSDSKGVSFSSQNFATIKIDPPASIVSLTPAAAHDGESITVTIAGNFTSFNQGTTIASFGAGISVGGAAPGAAGPVTVKSATEALASLSIDPDAANGTRDVTVTIGAQIATAKGAFTVLPALLPPTIIPGGPYIGAPGTPVSFDASASADPNGSALTLTWNFGDGSATATGAKLIHTFNKAGVYSVSLTGTDALGASAAAKTTATITAPVLPPIAKPGGPYTGTVGQSITFNGAGSSDPSGFALTYQWTFGDNAAGSGVSPTHSYATAGTYEVTLTVDNGHGKTNSASTTAAISASVKPPVANAGGPYTGVATQPVTFDGSASSDPNGYTLTYAWSFGDGDSGTGIKTTHSYTAAGKYTVTLTVDNGHGGTNSTSTTATVAAVQEPVANDGGPYSGSVGSAIAFSANKSTDPSGYALTYSWNFGDKTTGSGVSPTHSYTAAGTYTVQLTVSDGHGGTNTASTTATISAVQGPVANAGGPYTGAVGVPIAFSGSKSTDPSGYVLTYSWNFGDTSTATGVSPAHTYTAADTYNVQLTVSDGHGGTNTASTTATISAVAALPVAVTGGPYIGIPGQTIQFDGTQSYNPLTSTLVYSWNFGDSSTATGAQPTHAYAAPGSYTVTLTVNDGTKAASANTAATITAVVPISITSPLPGTLTNQPAITVNGTVGGTTATVSVNGTAANVSTGKWVASSVALREGVNLISATATAADGTTGTASISVTLDTTPPTVTVVSPAEGAKVFSPQLTVSGLVSDLVAGTINAQNVSITVNGVPASVVNRSYMAPNVILSPGMNTIAVVATDKAGNTGQTAVHVNYQAQITQQSILLVDGDGQTGVIDATLAQPLIARLVAANGQPMAGRPVTFTVTRSDGQVEALPNQGQALSVLSDANGKASVLFKLGSRAGVGVNQVVATSPGFTGQALFAATSTIDVPASIRAVIGEHQRGLIGQNAPKPFQVIVTDRQGNPLENVPVTFTVTAGGGNIGGATTVTQNTNSDGKATEIISLGMQEGIDNNLVTADYSGDTGTPVVFHASGMVPGAPTQTTVTGVVLDNTNTPVQGATARLENTNLSAATDAQGHFTLSGVPVGTVTLLVDGSTSSSTTTYPSLSFVLQALPGVNNALDMPIYLPAIDTENAQTVGGDQPVTLTMTGVPGVAFTVQPNSVTFPDGSKVGTLSVSQVKSDMVPMPPVNGTAAALVWTIQPAGAKFNPPIQVQLPNVDGLAPGTVTEIYQYDHDLEQFVSGGTARVSPDGSVIVSDPGFGIVKAGWGHSLPPLPPNNCTISCNEHNDCTQDYVTPQCTCRHKAINIGGNCNGTDASNPCQTVGTCDAYGHCTNSGNAKDGASCNDHVYCTNPDMCKSGACTGKPIPDQDQGNLTVGVDLTNLFAPFQSAADNFAPGLLSFQVNQSSSGKLSCCEQKNGAMLQKKNDKYNFRFQTTIDVPVEGVKIPSIPFTGSPIAVGLFNTYGGYVQGGLGVFSDKCTDNTCVTANQGQLSLQLGYVLKLQGGPPGAMLNVSAGLANASTVTLNTTDCHTLMTSFNLSTLKVSWSVVIPGTKIKLPGSTTDLFTGVNIPGPTYNFP